MKSLKKAIITILLLIFSTISYSQLNFSEYQHYKELEKKAKSFPIENSYLNGMNELASGGEIMKEYTIQKTLNYTSLVCLYALNYDMKKENMAYFIKRSVKHTSL